MLRKRGLVIPREAQEEIAGLLGEQQLPSSALVDPDPSTEEELLLEGMSSEDSRLPSRHSHVYKL